MFPQVINCRTSPATQQSVQHIDLNFAGSLPASLTTQKCSAVILGVDIDVYKVPLLFLSSSSLMFIPTCSWNGPVSPQGKLRFHQS